MIEPRRILSPKNATLRALLRLKERRGRDQANRFLIEGAREVKRAREAGVPLLQLLIAPGLLSPEARTEVSLLRDVVPTWELSDQAYRRLSYRQQPDGAMAVAATWTLPAAGLRLGPNALILVLVGLEKPGNVGALLRTADGAGVDAVLVTDGGTDLFNPNVIRASMGSLFDLPVLNLPTEAALTFLEKEGLRPVAAAPESDRTYWQENYLGPTALLLGSEHGGLPRRWLEAAANRVRIPMAGAADSLNVATAGALLIYEAVRQRHAFGEQAKENPRATPS